VIASQTEYQGRIDEALRRLGQLAGAGAPFTLELSPSDTELDDAVAAERDWARGMLYQTVAEYLDQLLENLGRLDPSTGAVLETVASQRVVRFSIHPEEGGLGTAVTKVNEGRLDLVFRAQSLMTCQSGWADIGHDLPDALAAATSPAEDANKIEPTADQTTGIERRLAALTMFVGDGVPWRFELAEDADAMDAAVTAEADYMKGQLLDTVEQLLGAIHACVERTTTPEILAAASADRTIVFEFAAIDDLPRRYLGSYQAVVKGGKLHFMGPAGDFKTNHGGWARIGEDVERAVMVARGETGLTEREARLAESLAAIAATSKGAEPGSRVCTMCKGTKLNTCNACHGKGSGCSVCKGSGRSRSKCSSCGGAGTK
jgi:hypothetical protein